MPTTPRSVARCVKAQRDTARDERFDEVEHGPVVERDRLFGPEVRQPAEAVAQRPALLTRLLHVLVRPLQRGDGEPFGHMLPRLPHHPTLVASVPVQRHEQRRRLIMWRPHVVKEPQLRPERKVTLQRLALLNHSIPPRQ
jgi:hypothetical protein